MILALILVEVVRPSFNSLTQKSIYIHYTDPTLIIGLLSILIITGLVAGLYPAIVLSSFKPIRILKGVFTSGKGGRKFINILVVIQFSISISLIIVSIVVGKQMHFINNKDLGLNKENVIVIPYNQEIAKRFDGFKEELMSNPSIVNVSAAYNLPTDHNSYVGLNWEGNPSEEGIGIIYNMVDYDFIETVGMKMLAGRSFSKDFADDDSISYIINETALRRMNDKNPIGLNVKFLHPGFPERFKRGKIIGVVKDFHLRPLREEIIPFAMRVYRPWYFHILIKYNTTDVHGLIDYLQGISIKYAPESPFSYSFFDQEVSKLYTLEYKAGKLITYFTILSIIISCMGLLGLTIQELEQKRKQVGIRKTLGASTSNLILSFSFSFLKRLVISFVIASVIGVFAIEKILQDYAYKTEITIWIFVGAFAIAIFIALATIIFQTYKASVKNPMESLKYE
jgi:ABC-type antimicrobial peptide transport system permease subunit